MQHCKPVMSTIFFQWIANSIRFTFSLVATHGWITISIEQDKYNWWDCIQYLVSVWKGQSHVKNTQCACLGGIGIIMSPHINQLDEAPMQELSIIMLSTYTLSWHLLRSLGDPWMFLANHLWKKIKLYKLWCHKNKSMTKTLLRLEDYIAHSCRIVIVGGIWMINFVHWILGRYKIVCMYVVLFSSPLIEGAHLVVTCKLCSAKTTYSELRFDHIASNMCWGCYRVSSLFLRNNLSCNALVLILK